jgi:glutathione S-transferase
VKIYFSPLACSLASRIALYDAGGDAEFVEVDSKTKTTPDGADFRAINPLGLVPTLRTDDGEILTENAAVLQYIAERFPSARLAPPDAPGRTRLHEWLSFVGTELHKGIYSPLLSASAPEGARSFALAKVPSRLSVLAARLEGREYALASFSVVDGYLFTVLNWSSVTPVDLAPWPAIGAYRARLRDRPSVARAFQEERALYAREQARG